MKKLIALFLTTLLLLTVFAGCGKKEVTNNQDIADNGQDSNLTEPGTFPIVKEKVTISIFTHPTPERKVDSYDAADNKFSAWYQDYTNVDFDFTLAPSAEDITTTLSTLLSSGEAPDILLFNSFSPEQQTVYGEQGVLLELTDLVKQNAPHIQAWWEKHPQIKEGVTFPGEKVYALNYENVASHAQSWNKIFVFQPWLDALGLATPKTTEEFYQTLLAFKNDDPNGNGKQDEIPLIGNTSWLAWKPLAYLMAPFEYVQDSDTGSNVFVNNQQVYASYTTQGYREGLTWINKLYTEGLIAPETFTMSDMSTYRTIVNQEPNIVGFMPSHAAYTASEMYADDYVMMGPLEGPSGETRTIAMNTISNAGVVISGTAEEPEVCIRVLDGLYTEDVVMRANVGEEGVDWVDAEEGATNQLGGPAKYHVVNSGSHYDPEKISANAVWPMAMYLRGIGVGDDWYMELQDYDETAANYDLQLNKWTEELYFPYLPDSEMLLPVNLVIPSEIAAEFSDIATLVKETQDTWTLNFILGQADIETQWDAYLAELDAVGLQDLLKIYQDAYDDMQG